MSLSRRVALIVAVVLVCDQLTKHWAVSQLNGGRVIDVVWTLRFALGFNSGFAFSQGQGLGPFIGVIAVGASIWLVRAAVLALAPMLSYGYALIAGGAIGNVVDRIFREDKWMRGRVVDFIDFQWFPVFNIADSSITVGAVVLVLGLWRQSYAERQEISS
jgi:signal peptidase II